MRHVLMVRMRRIRSKAASRDGAAGRGSPIDLAQHVLLLELPPWRLGQAEGQEGDEEDGDGQHVEGPPPAVGTSRPRWR